MTYNYLLKFIGNLVKLSHGINHLGHHIWNITAHAFRLNWITYHKTSNTLAGLSELALKVQLANYQRGNPIGFESTKTFTDINRIVFSAYDMILTMSFHSFGNSMSKDLSEQVFNYNPKWKFHVGKYIKEYARD